MSRVGAVDIFPISFRIHIWKGQKATGLTPLKNEFIYIM